MRLNLSILFVAIAAAVVAQPALCAPGSPAELRTSKRPIKGQYIVVLKDNAASLAGERSQAARVADVARGMSAQHGTQLLRSYQSVLRGYAVRANAASLAKLLADPRVAYVEEDGIATPNPTQTGGGEIWGLDRIDQRYVQRTGDYTYSYTGAGVHAYVIDSGLNVTHSEFAGRVGNGADFIGGGVNDCNGHGTHVAGTLAGTTWGIAKAAIVHPVRVFDCTNNGSPTSTIVAGVDWVANNRQLPAVANMSLGGPPSASKDAAVQNLINRGVTVVVSAGNDNGDACTQSPANLPRAITVGATDFNDNRSSFSNFGTCVDLFAPGSAITSAWINGNTASNTISGTSMASPHVAGIAALYLQTNPGAAPDTVAAAIRARSTHGQIADVGAGSPNRLAYWPGSGSWDLETAGNFIGNGRTDLIWRNYLTGAVAFWNMNGTSIAGTGIFNTVNLPEWQLEGSGDLNSDGRPDLVWRNYLTGEIGVWYMGSSNGSPVLLSTQLITPSVTDGRWQIEAIADFNGDGKVDLLWRNYSTGQNAYWYLNGAQLIGTTLLETVSDLAWRIEGAGDFNGDGKKDWVWRNYATGEIAYWYMNGVTRIGIAVLTEKINLNWHIDGVADMNGDSRPDFLWRADTTGENVVWHMGNTSVLSRPFLTKVVD
jgi:subtilisin family serine protease